MKRTEADGADGPTPSERDRAAVSGFFDAFDDAFASFDGDVIAERYATPYLACRGDGSAESFVDRAAVARYFQAILDGYRQQGVRSCRHRSLEVTAIGRPHLVGTVTWELLDEGRAVVVSWRESYVLIRRDGELAARASIDHPMVHDVDEAG